MVPWYILRPIRNIYLTLHLHTDSAPTAFDASTGDDDDILTIHPHIPCATSPAIIHTRHLTPMMSLSPQPFLVLSYLATLHWSLLSLPMRHPRLYRTRSC
jgi:hypothetical protein